MTNSRRTRLAADVALGYAGDDSGRGIAYAAVNIGNAVATVRLPFMVARLPGLDGLEQGYAAMAVVGAHLKARGFSRVRIRTADSRLVADLGGAGSPPKSLAMAYVRVRCVLRSLGAVKLEVAQAADVRDLTARAQADAGLHAAA